MDNEQRRVFEDILKKIDAGEFDKPPQENTFDSSVSSSGKTKRANNTKLTEINVFQFGFDMDGKEVLFRENRRITYDNRVPEINVERYASYAMITNEDGESYDCYQYDYATFCDELDATFFESAVDGYDIDNIENLFITMKRPKHYPDGNVYPELRLFVMEDKNNRKKVLATLETDEKMEFSRIDFSKVDDACKAINSRAREIPKTVKPTLKKTEFFDF